MEARILRPEKGVHPALRVTIDVNRRCHAFRQRGHTCRQTRTLCLRRGRQKARYSSMQKCSCSAKLGICSTHNRPHDKTGA